MNVTLSIRPVDGGYAQHVLTLNRDHDGYETEQRLTLTTEELRALGCLADLYDQRGEQREQFTDYSGRDLWGNAGGKPNCPECNDTGIVWFDVDTPGTPHYCGGCSDYPGIRHEPACGTEPCPNDCPVVPQRWTAQGATT